ncbi:MAG TPA: hypothetical protein VK470_09925 [Bacteroidota bacterium]|nr:hypothetical protein [Bacteroidota bacterium]
MKNTTILCSILCITLVVTGSLFGDSGRQYRKSAVMNGNDVRTVFGNWGVIGQPASGGPRGAWKNDNNGYLGDVSPLVGAEINWKGTKFHSVLTSPVDRPTVAPDRDPQTQTPWAMEPVGGYDNPKQGKIALSTDKNSWPPFWPDKLNDIKDPGWKGSWNGYFGKRISADMETYFVMDDNNDYHFNVANKNILGVAFKPDSLNPSRNGMALEIRARALQWNDFLAKDNIFWLYDIANTGTTNYNNAVFGFLVGTYVGVTGTDDSPNESNDDWSFYDVYNNLTYTGDFKHGGPSRNPLWVGKVGMVGYAFLESPGNPFDGIDNDGDADSSSIGRTAPKFTESMFTDSTAITVGKVVTIINNDYTRSSYTVPNVDSVIIPTRGNTTWIYPKRPTYVREGNAMTVKVNGLDSIYINPNAYDGVDNNYNGLIDENQYLHFRAVKRTRDLPPITLLDVPHIVHYIDYLKNSGTSPYSMIDEKRFDGIDNNNDWNFKFDDVGRDGIAGTGDFGEGDGLPTSGFDANGFDTGLPGEPHIDKTDVKESDQLGLTNFYYFTPSRNVNLSSDEEMWKNLSPGFFDVPKTIQNNRPVGGEDGDFIYGSGYFPLLAKSTERFSLALVYGGGYGGAWPDADIADLLKNKKTVQQIYDANYQFPLPPDKPHLTAVPGDGEVTLYWDRIAEESVDPVLLIKDFEGYKIYKSTDPNFSDIKVITDIEGVPKRFKPLATFDLVDGVKGYFQSSSIAFQQSGGLSYNMGTDTGLVHSYVDTDVQNGRRYFYALVAYDKGNEAIGLYPKENAIYISIASNGEITHDYNVAVVVPNAKAAGYVPAADASLLTHTAGVASGTINYSIVDQTRLTGHTYGVSFFDTQNDGLDNNGNGIMDDADSTEWGRVTSFYNVKDQTPQAEQFFSTDTSVVTLQKKNQDPATIVIKNAAGAVMPTSSYVFDPLRGTIKGTTHGSLPSGLYTASYQYYPVWRSPYIQNSPTTSERPKDTDVFDGIQLVFANDWSTVVDRNTSLWTGPSFQRGFSMQGVDILSGRMKLIRKPSDYEIQFFNTFVDTSMADEDFPEIGTPIPVHFKIFNTTENRQIKFNYYSSDPDSILAVGTQIIFRELGPNGRYVPTWTMFFGDPDGYQLKGGDKLTVKLLKPFNSSDQFSLKTDLPKADLQAVRENGLHVKVVPNPYVTASSFELPLNPGVTSGRGTRKVDFTHLPAHATIKVFTSRGDHVITLYQDGTIENGSVSWNLKTKENLDVAFGVYFYVVESPAGTQTGKLAIIK